MRMRAACARAAKADVCALRGPITVRSNALLGVATRECSNDKLRSLGNWQTRYLVQDIAARTVPLHKLLVNMLDPRKGVVALGIGRIDGFPRGKDEYGRVKGIGPKRGIELQL